MGFINKLLELSPYPEMLVRRLYYNVPKTISKIKKKTETSSFRRKKENKDTSTTKLTTLDSLIEHLKKMGIGKGDLLVVHSSMNGLSNLQCRENELIDALIDLIGSEGTVALPAFPIESSLDIKDGCKVYDPKRSIAWTGILPNLLLRRKGAIRSSFPYNPLVAFGLLAEDMTRHNLEDCYAHGPKSCWGFCVKNHAKILYLGLPAYHSFSLLHTIEDFQPEYWPDDWYIEQNYYVKQGEHNSLVKVKKRDLKWSKYISERYTEAKFIKDGLIKKADYNGISIRVIDDSYFFFNTIVGNWEKYKFFYFPKRMLHLDKAIKGI